MEEKRKSWICWVIHLLGGTVDESTLPSAVLGRGLRHWMETFTVSEERSPDGACQRGMITLTRYDLMETGTAPKSFPILDVKRCTF